MGLLGKLVEEVVRSPFDVIKGAADGLTNGIKQVTEPEEKK